MTASFETIPERRPRALVLDADAASVEAIRDALEQAGFDVLAASDGASGIELLLGELLDLDVLVADLDLPGRDARSFAHLVRRAGGEHDLALVVPACGATKAVRSELLALGVDAVVDRREGPRAVAAAARAATSARRSQRAGSAAAEPRAFEWASFFARWAPIAA